MVSLFARRAGPESLSALPKIDVGDPRPVRPVRTELALDQVGDCFPGRHALGPAAQREPGQPGPLHEQRHRVVADQQPVGALQLGAGPGLDVGAVGGVTGLAARREGCPCLGAPPASTRYPGGQGSNEMSGKRWDGPSSRWLSWWRRYLSKNAPMYVRSSVMAVFGLMVPRSDVT
jgi:hypothetical protein